MRVTDVNRKMVRADAIEVLDASPDRVPAPCPWAHADGCGGCDFQHVALPAQRLLKQEVLTDALRRFGRLDDDDLAGLDLTVHELPGHPDGLHWRTRMTWATDADGRLGLRTHRSHDVIPVDRCLIAAEGVDVPRRRPDRQGHPRGPRPLLAHGARTTSGRSTTRCPRPSSTPSSSSPSPRPARPGGTCSPVPGLFAAFLAEAVGADGGSPAVEASAAVKAARRALHDLPQVDLYEWDVRTWIDAVDHDAPDGVVLDPPRSGAGRVLLQTLAEAEVPDRSSTWPATPSPSAGTSPPWPSPGTASPPSGPSTPSP